MLASARCAFLLLACFPMHAQTTPGAYAAPGGGVQRALTAKLGDVVNAHDFTPCNGHGDDLPGLQRAQAFLLSRGGGTLHLPAGVCIVSDQFLLQNRVNLQGDNVAASQLNAGAAFPPGKAVLQLGAHSPGPDVHFQFVRDLTVNAAADPASIGIQSDNLQEGAYVSNLLVNGYGKYGINITGGQNAHLEDIYSGAQPRSQTAIGIRISNVTSRFAMSHITIYGGKVDLPDFPKMQVSETNAAILLENGADARITDVHVEGFRYGIQVDKWSYAEIDNFYGCFNTPTMVWFRSNSLGGTVRHLFMYPWPEPYGVPRDRQTGIQDDLHRISTKAPADAIIDEYITNQATLFTTSRTVMSTLGQLHIDNAQVNHLSGAGPVPTCTPGPAAGVGASCQLVAGHDAALELQLTTGANPVTGIVFGVLWGVPYRAAPFSQVLPTNMNAASIRMVYQRSQSTGAKSVYAAAAPLSAKMTYTFQITSLE